MRSLNVYVWALMVFMSLAGLFLFTDWLDPAAQRLTAQSGNDHSQPQRRQEDAGVSIVQAQQRGGEVVEPNLEQVLKDLEALLSDYHEPPNVYPSAMETFHAMGCQMDWVEEANTRSVVIKKTASLLSSHRAMLPDILADTSPRGYFVRAKLCEFPKLIKQHLSQCLLSEEHYQKAAVGGNPHALYYQVAKKLKVHRHTLNRPGDAKSFFEINDMLETAAMRGSGAAAYWLAKRLHGNVLKAFPEKPSGGKGLGQGKGPDYWYCYSASLGFPDGATSCARGMRATTSPFNEWLKTAARSGHDRANYNLANHYVNGSKGFPRSLELAKLYHCRAIYFGNQWSSGALRRIVEFEANQHQFIQPSQVSLKGNIVLDTERGQGKYDKMTYGAYDSSISLVPKVELAVREVKPYVYYCNGMCFFEFYIEDEDGKKLSTTYWQGIGSNQVRGILDREIVLKPNRAYKMNMKAWTSMSVGIYTTGQVRGDIEGIATYSTHSALMMKRGPIAFKLLN